MTLKEANKIISDYMGRDWQDCKCGGDVFGVSYTESLDALVPVWEKLNFSFEGWIAHDKCYMQLRGHFGGVKSMGKSETIQEAACLATAKAIEELND